jgi:superfamily II DNA or RNA helicase
MRFKGSLYKHGYKIKYNLVENDLIDRIKKELTVKPKCNGLFDNSVEYPVFLESESAIYVPKYYGICLSSDYVSYLNNYKKINISFNGELRDYQQNAIKICKDKMDNIGGGIISAPCGWGKTVFALKLISEYKVKTLVIVNKTFLQDQWYDKIREFTNARIGLIRQKKINIKNKDIVIGMLQSISMIDYNDEIFKDFGMVIYDEVHHTASKIFHNALSKTGARYTIGLSATPIRNDGLTKVIKWYIGDIIYEESIKKNFNVNVKSFNYNIDHKLFVEKTMWIKGKFEPSVQNMITSICKIGERNYFITDVIDSIVRFKHRKILVLSGRVEHLFKLKKYMDKRIKQYVADGIFENDELTTSMYIGSMKQHELADSVNADVIYATFAMAEEGLDIPALNTVILSTPKSSIIQAIGRIMRKTCNIVNPLIIDIVDQLSVFPYQYKKRLNIFKQRKYDINSYKIHYNDGICSILKNNGKSKKISRKILNDIFNNDIIDKFNHKIKYNTKINMDEIDFID